MPTLVVPGVRVEARFDVLPPLPAPSGVVGVVGIVDRPPVAGGLFGVSKITELRELLGAGTEASMPEAVHALANGASEVVVAAVGGGAPSRITLLNDKSQGCVQLRARSKGAWGNQLAADVRETRDASNKLVRIGLRILLNGRVVENFDDLQIAPGHVDDLFDVINSRSRYVVAVDPGFSGVVPADGTYSFADAGTPIDVNAAGEARVLMQLIPGDTADPHGLAVKIDAKDDETIDVQVFQRGLQEHFDDLVMDPDSDVSLPHTIITQSRLVRVRPASSLPADDRLPKGTDAPAALSGGTSPSAADFAAAIDLLSDDPRIDLVVAAIEPTTSRDDTILIHQSLAAHAVAAADAGAPRIAFGSIHPSEATHLDLIKEHAASVRNRRFVLVAPPGAAGAVAGMIGRMAPQESPTFKNVPLFGIAPAKYRESELNQLLGPATNALVVQNRNGHGVVVLRGIDSTGDQISVTRVADQAIRETKAISENFIGVLNTNDARIALRQQIISVFVRMTRAGALVPGVSGEPPDPPFLVDVYSTQEDFASGIVRIDLAVRPVRAIDFIYATLRVKN